MDTMNEIFGVVIEGEHIATGLGYPTANLNVDLASVQMADGVYAGHATLEGATYAAAIVIDAKRKKVEAHLLDYTGSACYGKAMLLVPSAWVNDLVCITDERELRKKINEDVARVRDMLCV